MNIPTVADVHLATIEGDEQGITPEEVRMALEAIPQDLRTSPLETPTDVNAVFHWLNINFELERRHGELSAKHPSLSEQDSPLPDYFNGYTGAIWGVLRHAVVTKMDLRHCLYAIPYYGILGPDIEPDPSRENLNHSVDIAV
jgi:hypothetical protein